MMTPEDRAAFHAAWALFSHNPDRNQEWDFKAGFEAALVHRDDKDRANASLIAAAPDLLEAAVDLVSRDFGYEGWDDACEQAALKLCAAVAKATGGSDD